MLLTLLPFTQGNLGFTRRKGRAGKPWFPAEVSLHNKYKEKIIKNIRMYYSKIGNKGTGFTNQIFALITSIMNAYVSGETVVIVDNFLNDITKPEYTPITEIFDIDEMNKYLIENYRIIIVDRNNINFELIYIKYGINEEKIDITNSIITEYYKDKKLYINKDIVFNDIQGDPCHGIEKNVYLKYKINGYYVEEIYEENLKRDIIIDFEGPYIYTLGWINTFNDNMFEKILTNIKYNEDFIQKAELIKKEINSDKKVNIIHLRLEEDGIAHWSKQNNMTESEYKNNLEETYINLIKNYSCKTDENIILSQSYSNGVIDYLKQHNYSYKLTTKFYNDREKNAIVDLLVSKYCNNIFIGNFNVTNLNGSTFSYYIGKCMKDDVIKLYIDLDKL